MTAYIRQLKELDAALKRANEQIKSLRLQKKATEENLYKYMVNKKLEEFQGISIKKITPKNLLPQKKKASEKKKEMLQLFSEIGADDPTELFKKVESIRKSKIEENQESGDVVYI